MDIKLNQEKEYKAAMVLMSDRSYGVGIATTASYIGTGDMVLMPNGKIGTVILVEDYVRPDNVMKIQEACGDDVQLIMAVYSKRDVNWEGKE